jgi:hypothetical protein
MVAAIEHDVSSGDTILNSKVTDGCGECEFWGHHT